MTSDKFIKSQTVIHVIKFIGVQKACNCYHVVPSWAGVIHLSSSTKKQYIADCLN